MGTHNTSETGRGARVALCAHTASTDTDNKDDVSYAPSRVGTI
jgi:hypothetical protein